MAGGTIKELQRKITPGDDAFLITPHNVNSLKNITRGVYVGITGDLHCIMCGGQEITFCNLAPGIVHPLAIQLVFATGTTAACIIGLY